MIRPADCPDCPAKGPNWRHDTTCPVGRALDATSADDRAWFDARPDARTRVRPVRPDERHWLTRNGCRVDPFVYVIVTRIAEGVRTRSYRGVTAPGTAFRNAVPTELDFGAHP